MTTDCHDTSVNDAASGGALANPHCFTGTTLVGVSTEAFNTSFDHLI